MQDRQNDKTTTRGDSKGNSASKAVTRSDSKGFTLVEFLIVIAVIGICTVLNVTSLSAADDSTNDLLDKIRKQVDEQITERISRGPPMTPDQISRQVHEQRMDYQRERERQGNPMTGGEQEARVFKLAAELKIRNLIRIFIASYVDGDKYHDFVAKMSAHISAVAMDKHVNMQGIRKQMN